MPSDDTKVPTIATNKSLFTGGISIKDKNSSNHIIKINKPRAPK